MIELVMRDIHGLPVRMNGIAVVMSRKRIRKEKDILEMFIERCTSIHLPPNSNEYENYGMNDITSLTFSSKIFLLNCMEIFHSLLNNKSNDE